MESDFEVIIPSDVNELDRDLNNYVNVKTNTFESNKLSSSILSAVDILCDEWLGSKSTRINKIIMDKTRKCIIIARRSDGVVISYAELEVSASSSDMDSSLTVPYGVLTSFIIAREYRRLGIGSVVLKMLENEARNRGYCYLYLWTSDAVGFYRKVGYQDCEPVNCNKSVLKSLNDESVSKLELIMRNKFKKDEDKLSFVAASAKDVWLRKRLITTTTTTYTMNWEEFQDRIISQIKCKDGYVCKYFYHSISWQRQVGPSCGLTALSMIHQYYHSQHNTQVFSSSSCHDDTCIETDSSIDISSLLQLAISRGFTSDGEIFNINHLNDINNAYLDRSHIESMVMSSRDLTPSYWIETLLSHQLIMIAYDRDDLGSLPCLRGGIKAHYTIIIGFAYLVYDTIVEGKLSHNSSNIRISLSDEVIDCKEESFYLIGLHSLSPRPVVAKMSEWMDSNAQLLCDKKYFPQQWILGDDTVSMDLSNKLLVLKLLK